MSTTEKLNRLLKPLQSERALLVMLVLFAFLFRLKTLEMVESGGDAVNKVLFIKQLIHHHALDSWKWTHHNARFGVNVPAYLSLLLTGSHAVGYYLPTVLMSVLQVVCVFKIGLRIQGRLLGFCAAVSLVLFPQMIRNGCQLLPGVYTGAYVLLATYGIVEWHHARTGKRRRLLLASLAMFLAYLSWVGSLFFMPAFLLGIYVLSRKPKDVILFGGVLLLLFFVETGLWITLTDQSMGRLGIITGKHLKSSNLAPLPSAWDLFGRYTILKSIWPHTLIAFLIASVGIAVRVRRIGGELLLVTLLPLSFLLCLTFAITSTDPIMPALTIKRPRYLTPAIPFLMLAIWGGFLTLVRLPRPFSKSQNAPYFALLIVFLLTVHNDRYSGIDQHPLLVLPRYRKTFNEAFAEGVPILGSNARLDRRSKSLKAARAILWDVDAFPEYEDSFPPIRKVRINGRRRALLYNKKHRISARTVKRHLKKKKVMVETSRPSVPDEIYPYGFRPVLRVERKPYAARRSRRSGKRR